MDGQRCRQPRRPDALAVAPRTRACVLEGRGLLAGEVLFRVVQAVAEMPEMDCKACACCRRPVNAVHMECESANAVA
jgi:hypothetical protein